MSRILTLSAKCERHTGSDSTSRSCEQEPEIFENVDPQGGLDHSSRIHCVGGRVMPPLTTPCANDLQRHHPISYGIASHGVRSSMP